ncbi:MAG: pyridoxine 5'-phosphate synthase [Phycisphaerae bacterium]|nr:pyridoxine 5'-phosphate synthase [Phycisphaerae bacterium]
MTKLSVNLNKIALLRNQRDIGIPNVIKAAKMAISAGAYGITVHPRPDERHIRYADVYELAKVIEGVEFNIEGNPFTGKYMDIIRDVRPDQATLVPDAPGANTSDHGWDLNVDGERLVPIIEELKSLGVRVSLFMDPDFAFIKMAKKLGADRIELYTEPYAKAFESRENFEQILGHYVNSAKEARNAGLGVNAGHDLNLDNLGTFCKAVPNVLEVSIGHALISDAIDMGLAEAVKEYLRILEEFDNKTKSKNNIKQ